MVGGTAERREGKDWRETNQAVDRRLTRRGGAGDGRIEGWRSCADFSGVSVASGGVSGAAIVISST